MEPNVAVIPQMEMNIAIISPETAGNVGVITARGRGAMGSRGQLTPTFSGMGSTGALVAV